MNLQIKRSSTRGLWPRPKVLEAPIATPLSRTAASSPYRLKSRHGNTPTFSLFSSVTGRWPSLLFSRSLPDWKRPRRKLHPQCVSTYCEMFAYPRAKCSPVRVLPKPGCRDLTYGFRLCVQTMPRTKRSSLTISSAAKRQGLDKRSINDKASLTKTFLGHETSVPPRGVAWVMLNTRSLHKLR